MSAYFTSIIRQLADCLLALWLRSGLTHLLESKDREVGVREIFCSNCAELFTPSSRHGNQTFCMKPQCRKARKASLQREKMKTDPDYRADQKLSKKKWSASRPDYWKEYRKDNSDKAERNRLLQTVRNGKRKKGKEAATRDASRPSARKAAWGKETFSVCGRCWLIPMSPKAAPLDVRIVTISRIWD